MKFLLPGLVWVAAFYATQAFGQTSDEEKNTERATEIPAAELTGFMGDGGLQLDESDAEDSWLKRFAERWPSDLVVAPVPGRSPQLGWTLAVGAGYFIQSKSAEPTDHPSILGGFAMFAENGSYAYGLGGNLHLVDDRLRIKAGAGFADVRYRYYGRGDGQNQLPLDIDILQEMPMYFAQGLWNVWNRLYVGLGYLGGEVDTRVKITINNPNLPDSIALDIGALTVPFEFDTRDHEQFPRKGWLVDGRATYYRESYGGDFDSDIYKIAFNYYHPVGDTDVLASRLMLRGTDGSTPFFLLSTFGGSKDLRGYPSGRYRDRMMYALQSEYRWQFNDKWIFTGFAGVGEVANSFGEFGDNFLPAAGIGARFVLSQKHKVGLSFDVAQGKHGTEFYFGVGEAF